MSCIIKMSVPFKKEALRKLKAGDEVLLSGVIYTARDAAHKRFAELLARGRKLPLDLKGACIYYCGPTPGRPGCAIGSCGPTTGSRMDAFTPALIRLGITAMIGKGRRSDDVKKSVKKHGCVYFLAPAGLGALLAAKVRSAKIIAFRDLGPEAVYKLEVENFPLIVGIDSKGRDLYAKK